MDVVHNPGNTHPINKLYVWLSVDEEGNEGIMAINNMPCVTSEERISNLLKDRLEQMPRPEGINLVLAEFERK